jgi:hypothetical protein
MPTEGPALWSEAVTITLEGPPQPGAEPAWWSNVDRNQSPPTVIDAKVTHETRSAAQIAAAKSGVSAEAQPRRLRSETFRLDEIRQTAYEVPARSARVATAEEEAETEASTAGQLGGIDPEQLRELLRQQVRGRSVPRVSHPLSGAASEPTSTEAHPFRQQAARHAAQSVHPLAGTGEPVPDDESAEPIERVRLGQGPSFAHPPHPLSQRPAWAPLGSSLPPIESVGSDATTMPAASDRADAIPAHEEKSPTYGTWHPLGG